MTESKLAEALTILSEECGEVVQVAAKCQRFGIDGVNPVDNSTNRGRLTQEIGDLVCMIEILTELDILDQQEIQNCATIKRQKLEQWSNLFQPDPEALTVYNIDEV
jgi:NTP pyrophosphatase (non-canonical NTP hydrolase)